MSFSKSFAQQQSSQSRPYGPYQIGPNQSDSDECDDLYDTGRQQSSRFQTGRQQSSRYQTGPFKQSAFQQGRIYQPTSRDFTANRQRDFDSSQFGYGQQSQFGYGQQSPFQQRQQRQQRLQQLSPSQLRQLPFQLRQKLQQQLQQQQQQRMQGWGQQGQRYQHGQQYLQDQDQQDWDEQQEWLQNQDRDFFTMSSSAQRIRTPVTELLGIKHPVLLAGMNVAAGPKLAAAVTNAGGLGVIGGLGYTPEMLQEQIDELKSYLNDQDAPFGVDLLLPQIGGTARKTNYDYTKGKLDELVDIIVNSGARLFVSAVGCPPRHIVEKLHRNGVLYMNMVGHPKHVRKCLDLGVDIICAQGGEGGGHTGHIPTTVLIPAVVELCKGARSPMTGKPVQVLAAGGMYNGNSLAAALMLGASGIWVGTRFILCDEAGAPTSHQEAVQSAGFDDNIRTLIFTGRPLRVKSNKYIQNWEQNRRDEIQDLTSRGKIPVEFDMENFPEDVDEETLEQCRPYLMGQVSALINERKPAREIVDEIVQGAVHELERGNRFIVTRSRF